MPQFDITALDHTAKSTTLTSVINKHRIHSYAELTSSDSNVQDQKGCICIHLSAGTGVDVHIGIRLIVITQLYIYIIRLIHN